MNRELQGVTTPPEKQPAPGQVISWLGQGGINMGDAQRINQYQQKLL